MAFMGSELPSSFRVGFYHPSAAEEEPPKWNKRQEGRHQGVDLGPSDCICALANSAAVPSYTAKMSVPTVCFPFLYASSSPPMMHAVLSAGQAWPK